MKQPVRYIVFILINSLLFFTTVSAQLCQGSLGDPVVNITFGTGPNYGPPLSTSNNNYNYVSSGCPNDGSYTIANSSPNCFTDSWHALTQDHTPGDVNGYMMLVNASFAAGDFYVQQVDGLCGNITYEFASWITNVEKPFPCNGNPIKPNVTFKIETLSGDVLMKYESGDIPSTGTQVWQQYGSFFTMPANTSSVIIRMTNNAAGGCGNDLALDDITFRPCGAKVTANISGDGLTKNTCIGDASPLSFTGVVEPDNNSTYQWQSSTDGGTSWIDIPGATGKTYTRPAINVVSTNLFRLSVSQSTDISIASCRVSSEAVSVIVNALPDAAASNNSPVCDGQSLKLTASGGASYLWTGPNGFTSSQQSPEFVASLNQSGQYLVTVATDKGCVSSGTTDVIIKKTPVINIINNSIDICEGDGKPLTTTSQNVTNYAWTPAVGLSDATAASPVASPSDTITYVVKVGDGNCTSSDSVVVNVIKKPLANAGPDKELLEGSSVALEGVATGSDVSVKWSPAAFLSSTNTINPIASPPHDTTYLLQVTSNKGCGVSTDAVVVKVFKNIVVPNAFSPNGDGVNDVWVINHLSDYPEANISVYSRYGKLVFTAKGNYQPWDGTYNGAKLPMGTYYYVIDLQKNPKKYTGWVFIVK